MIFWDTVSTNFVGFLFVLCRVSGIFTFNPIFSRSNVPTMVKNGMCVVLAVIMTMSPAVDASVPEVNNIIGFGMIALKELFIGMVFGFFTNLVMTVLIYAGEIIDMQTGMGMAKTMDPTTGINMPVFANIYYYLFILYFFLTNGHLSYIQLFTISYETIPVGYEFTLNTINLTHTIVMYFGTVMTLAVKFALPIMVTEMITEVCVGLLMKAVPTIQVMVVNIQLKIIVGLLILSAAARPMSEFIDKLLGILWENLYTAASNFA